MNILYNRPVVEAFNFFLQGDAGIKRLPRAGRRRIFDGLTPGSQKENDSPRQRAGKADELI